MESEWRANVFTHGFGSLTFDLSAELRDFPGLFLTNHGPPFGYPEGYSWPVVGDDGIPALGALTVFGLKHGQSFPYGIPVLPDR